MIGRHRLVRQDLDEGPARRRARARWARRCAPPESFNNELGHPYTALRADDDTRYLVLELSARGIGHIAALARIAPPRIGVVLNVGTAHLGEFGSVEAIAQAKGELVEALPRATAGRGAERRRPAGRRDGRPDRRPGGHCRRSAERRRPRRGRRPWTTGPRPVHAWSRRTGSAPVALRLVGAPPGRQRAGRRRGGGASSAAPPAGGGGGAARPAAPASRWRMEVTDRADGVTVVNDAYNANPDSMAAALRALAAMGGGRRTWAVLGQMARAGRGDARPRTRGRRRWPTELGVDRVVVTVDRRRTYGRRGEPARGRRRTRPRRCCAPSWRRATSCW